MLLLFATGASAVGWSPQTMPNASGAEDSVIAEVACEPSTTNACTAVGKRTIAGVTTPFAESWDGSQWLAKTAAVPREATESELKGNFCSSTTNCLAVGFYRTLSGQFTLAEVWNGSGWALQSTPTPAGATEIRLNGVACSTSTACTAVGYSVVSSVRSVLAVRWNGTTWSLQSVPVPAGTTASELESVQCRSATSCMAVGRFFERSGAYKALSVTWNGTLWSLQTVPNPLGTSRSILIDVGCTEVATCTAVGAFTSESGVQRTLVERWNGLSWTVQPSPNPSGSTNSVFQNVSCAERSSCIAVGDWLSSGTWTPLAESWNGTEWAIENSPTRAGVTFSILEGVSCRGLTCLAAGWSTDASGDASAEGQIRSRWTTEEMSVPSGRSGAVVNGVSCSSTTFCMGVGSSILEVTGDIVAYKWNGTSWAVTPTPVMSEDGLVDVSCVSSTFCVAVGPYWPDEEAIALHWNGTSWSPASTPRPRETLIYLRGVSCTATTACTAVGGASGPTSTQPFILRWNGVSWATQAVPSVGAQGHLEEVSCSSSTSCLAVGVKNETSSSPDKTLALRWDGTSWSVQSTPNPAEAESTTAAGVSCSSSSACTAVGNYFNEADQQPMAMRWNGTAWSLQAASVPSGASGGQLTGVTCLSGTFCTAVGSYSRPNAAFPERPFNHTLALQWDGSAWTTEKPPSITSSAGLNEVVCLTTTWCKAVGSYSSRPLAEQFLG